VGPARPFSTPLKGVRDSVEVRSHGPSRHITALDHLLGRRLAKITLEQPDLQITHNVRRDPARCCHANCVEPAHRDVSAGTRSKYYRAE
jgi:hypothetical protein